jgi:hypothetical protein
VDEDGRVLPPAPPQSGRAIAITHQEPMPFPFHPMAMGVDWWASQPDRSVIVDYQSPRVSDQKTGISLRYIRQFDASQKLNPYRDPYRDQWTDEERRLAQERRARARWRSEPTISAEQAQHLEDWFAKE